MEKKIEVVKEESIYCKLLNAVDSLPKEAVEVAKKEITRKGYDTTGYQYQFLVNVLNEILGLEGWSFTYQILKEFEGKWTNGKPYWEITVDIKVNFNGIGERNCVGGHKAELHSDALKGAITNGFKKTIALFGVGKKAYEGTIDEDYRPLPEQPKAETKKPVQQKAKTPEITFEDLSDSAKEIMAAFDRCSTVIVLSHCVTENKTQIDNLSDAEANYLRSYYIKRKAELGKVKK